MPPLPPATIQNLDSVVAQVISVVLSLVGIAILAMLIVGGFQYLTAGSDKDKTAKARLTLTYAISGFVLVVASWIILRLIGLFIGNETFFRFTICLPGQSC